MNATRFFPFIAGGILVLALAAGAGYFYYQYQQTQQELVNIKNDPNILGEVASEETKRLIEEVGRLITLPEGEDPTVATITDIEKLKDQAFFQKAKNGDKVLIYTNAKKAVLYDPQAKKIIDVAPVNIGSSSAQQNSTSTQDKVKIVLKNGTSTTGLTTKVEPDIKKVDSNIEVVAKENASKTDYEKTVVILSNNSFSQTAQKLAQSLGVEVNSSLPEGETNTQNADIVVILGKDRI